MFYVLLRYFFVLSFSNFTAHANEDYSGSLIYISTPQSYLEWLKSSGSEGYREVVEAYNGLIGISIMPNVGS